MKALIAALALIAATSSASANDKRTAEQSRYCPSDPVTCWMTQTTRFECGTGDPLLCWFGEYADPSKPRKPSINEGW